MTTLLFVRHGESEANREEIFAGHLDVNLHEKGIIQAQKTAQYIKEHYNIDKVYASDLKRAYKTGECIAKACRVPIIGNEALREISAGEWEGVSFSMLYEKYADTYKRWCTDVGNAGCDGGETVKELAERILTEVTKIAKENEGKQIVIATHATPVRVMQCIALDFPIEKMRRIPWVSNASVTEITFENDRFSLIEASIDAHLSELKTVLPANV